MQNRKAFIFFAKTGFTAFLLSGVAVKVLAQASLPIYTDRLVNAFQDWGWGTRNLSDNTVVHSGTNSIRASLNQWQALSFYHANLDTRTYASLSFWAHGGSSGGQVFQAVATVNGADQSAYRLPALTANAWRQFIIPLATLHAAGQPNMSKLTLQLTSNSSGACYFDDIEFKANPAPAVVDVTVDAAIISRIADSRWFGVNAAVWDSNFKNATTLTLLKEIGAQILRFPGGSLSDEYHWGSNKSGNNTWQWATSFTDFAKAATNIGAAAMITVNYGSGTAAEAAGWVRHSNVTNKYGFNYWEIGNENYGTWETDTNANAHDAFTYATRSRDYIQQMRAADPTIKIGVVAAPGEDSYVNGNTSHPATNSITGQVHYGWTPVLLATLKQLGVKPDFLVNHHYPQWTGSGSTSVGDSDPLLLASSSAWLGQAADLRQMLSAYYGPASTDIELLVTENNSDSGAQGRQSTSLVNGLYYADSLGQLMQTEFNAYIWWDLRNGTDRNGAFDPSLYGWRDYGDLGMINGIGTRHPTFYAAKLFHMFAAAGDSILRASADYPLVSAYAAGRSDGSLSLLLLNKDSVTNLTANIDLSGFVPSSTATVWSYGIPQDEAARTNAPLAQQDLAVTMITNAAASFARVLPPLSMTLISLVPTPPAMSIEATRDLKAVLVRMQAQNGTYVVQQSSDLVTWDSVSTNSFTTSSSITITNSADQLRSFWRAVRQEH